MKKVWNIMRTAALAWAVCAFAACDDTGNGDDNGNGGNNGGGGDEPGTSDVRVVTKLTNTYTEDGKPQTGTAEFIYDDKGRVSKLVMNYSSDSDVDFTIDYNYTTHAGKVVVTAESGEKGDAEWMKITIVGTLNSDGYITSAEYTDEGSSLSNEGQGEPEPYYGTYTAEMTYDGKKLVKLVYDGAHTGTVVGGGDDEVPFITTNECEWTGDNMTKVTRWDVPKGGDGSYNPIKDFSVSTYEAGTRNDASIDLNALIYEDEFFANLDDTFLSFAGLLGQPSKELVKSTKTTFLNNPDTYDYSYSYEKDAEGYATKCTSVDYDKSESVITLEYKK